MVQVTMLCYVTSNIVCTLSEKLSDAKTDLTCFTVGSSVTVTFLKLSIVTWLTYLTIHMNAANMSTGSVRGSRK
jgi:hypothetical protein